jgi:hypothetical protein
MTSRHGGAREARLAAALKENLKRRKAQTRARDKTVGEDAEASEHPSDRPKSAPKPF